MKSFLALLGAALPYLLCLGLVAGFAWFTWSAGYDTATDMARRELATVKADHQAELLRISLAQAQREGEDQARARKRERDHAQALAAIDSKYSEEFNNAKAVSDRTISDLRAGVIRLRQWPDTGAGKPGTFGNLPAAGPSAGLGDGPSGGWLGIDGAARIIGAADTGDGWAAQLSACQAIVRADRGEVTP